MSCIKTPIEKGLNLTPQRWLIIDAIHTTDMHPATGEIVHQVQAIMPELKKLTIFRTLDFLERNGSSLISELIE